MIAAFHWTKESNVSVDASWTPTGNGTGNVSVLIDPLYALTESSIHAVKDAALRRFKRERPRLRDGKKGREKIG
jgi:hypothetical protein